MTKIFASIAMHIRILQPDISHLFFKSKKIYIKNRHIPAQKFYTKRTFCCTELKKRFTRNILMLLKLNIIESYNYSNFDSTKLNNMQFVFHHQPNIISRLQIFMEKLNLFKHTLLQYILHRISILGYSKVISPHTYFCILQNHTANRNNRNRSFQNHPSIILSTSKRKKYSKSHTNTKE